MDSKIEQVKKIITDLCDGCEVDGVSTGLIEIASKEIVSALYSEPQVCPKPEQMMICPVETCFRKCEAKKPHQRNVSCEMECAAGYIAPCNIIPVPSTPAREHIGDVTEMIAQHGTNVAHPDELLTDITKILDEIVSIARAGALMQHFKGKGVESKTTTQYAQDILLKCHQSEANIEEQLTEIVCSQYTRAEKAEARIKELKGLTDSLQEKIETIRADQNRKIGEWLESESLYETSSGYLVSNEIIAKIQKGEEVK